MNTRTTALCEAERLRAELSEALDAWRLHEEQPGDRDDGHRELLLRRLAGAVNAYLAIRDAGMYVQLG